MTNQPRISRRGDSALWATILLIIVATAGAVALSMQLFNHVSDAWYMGLIKPSLTPPAAVLAPIWLVLFTLMVASAVLIRIETRPLESASPAYGLYFLQLSTLVMWVLFLLHYKEIDLSLGILCALWLVVVSMIQEFDRHSRLAALLQLPYLGWLTFMIYLNGHMLIGNSG